MKPTLVLPIGLPRSGKSTWLKSQGYPIVCPDEVRRYLGCFPFDADREPEVWKIVRCMVHTLFASGAHHVALDATNNTIHRRNQWKNELWRREFVRFYTPKEVCIERAIANEQSYLIPVIERMDREHEPVTTLELSEGDSWEWAVTHTHTL